MVSAYHSRSDAVWILMLHFCENHGFLFYTSNIYYIIKQI
uniref:Uncharacterized protein n=1 Tax=Heterorhabditis bacteriophora TaxID=37862 RepID=A0A1I7X3N3_HETBA